MKQNENHHLKNVLLNAHENKVLNCLNYYVWLAIAITIDLIFTYINPFGSVEWRIILSKIIFWIALLICLLNLLILIANNKLETEKIFRPIIPKRYYLKRVEDGKLKIEDVAIMFNTSSRIVEKGYKKYIKSKKPFNKKLHSNVKFLIQTVVTISTSLLSGILVLATLFEMQAERNAAYMPCVSISSTEVAIAWDQNGKTKDLDEELIEDVKYFLANPETKINEIPVLKLYNIGAGTAKQVEVLWNTQRNVDSFNEVFRSIGKEVTYEKKFDHIYVYETVEDKANGACWAAPAISRDYFDFILTSEKDYCSLFLPRIYYMLIEDIFISGLIWKTDVLPILTINIKCLDIQNKVYEKNIEIYINRREGMGTRDKGGYYIFDLIAIEA